jgi:hypothetical protein
VRASFAVRELALAGLAILAAATVLAVRANTEHHRIVGPRPVGSYVALVGSAGTGVLGRKTACGGVIEARTEGVAHPTLPCGVRIFLTYRGRTVLVPVIDRGPFSAGREMDVTDALAGRLGLSGVREVHWSYAAVR